MLRSINIKKGFNSRQVLKGVCFDAPNSKLTVLEGKNGAGKSTLFNIISGIERQDSGQIWLQDVDISQKGAIERAKQIGILKQDPKSSSVPSLSIADNLALARLKNKRSALLPAVTNETKQAIITHLKELSLPFENDLARPMDTLSGGQRQILAFAMVTITKPDLLLLDEPTAALDEKSSHKLMELIKHFVKRWNIPALMISHDHDLNDQYADKIIVLNEGIIEMRADKITTTAGE